VNILNPVLLTEHSTQKLPRALLLCMLVAYALSGLIGRDPWRGDDAVGFGMALSMAQGQWWTQLQSVAGAGVAMEGPLWFSIVGGFINLLPFLPAHVAAKVPVALCTLTAAYALWYATYYLAKTPAAQPLALALGGQPKPIAYARAVADGAVLLLLATFGIALSMHEINAQTAQFALLCGLMLGASLSLYKPLAATAINGCMLVLLGSSNGLLGVLPALAWLAVVSALPAWSSLRRSLPLMAASAAVGFAIPFLVAHWLGQTAYIAALWSWNMNAIGIIPWARLSWLMTNLPFLAWPAVPFAVAAIWRWRRFWRAPHVWAGVSYMGVFFTALLCRTSVNDAVALSLLPGALILAAFLLPALPRAWMNAIDWFGVMALSFLTALVWLVWIAMTLGWPPALAKSVLRLTPGFDTSVQWFALLVGLLATLFWCFVVRWRVLSAKTVVWRAAVVWSAGSLTLWVVIGSLFMPYANHIKTYRAVATELKAALKDHSQCVSPLHLGLPQRAMMAYFGDIRFEVQPLQVLTDVQAENAPIDTPVSVGCNWLLEYAQVQRFSDKVRANYLPNGVWVLKWEGRRFRDKTERFRLYQREPAQ
jgi:4-amino-4-deoxy-L-arabinose transferase-like glycosyltransferase